MKKSEFKRGMEEIYKKMEWSSWTSYSCEAIAYTFNSSKMSRAYCRFISIFLKHKFKLKHTEHGPELRMLLLRSFELEVLKSWN